MWTVVPGGEDADAAAVNLAYRYAQRELWATVEKPELLSRARRQAEQVIRTFLRELRWDVAIRWRSS